MPIPKQMLKEWCETYEEAIETLDYLANRSVGTAKEEIKESLDDKGNTIFAEEEYRDGYLCPDCQMSEEEFEEVSNET